MQSYDYAQRTGTEEITWDRFADLARRLVEKLAPYNIEAFVGPARAGLFPATVVSLMLRRELYPVCVSRRMNDMVQFQHPQWTVDVAANAQGKMSQGGRDSRYGRDAGTGDAACKGKR